jgi:hypothetical protein
VPAAESAAAMSRVAAVLVIDGPFKYLPPIW